MRLENVSYYYPETTIPALKEIDLSISQGEFVLLAGPSGCGKSTFSLLLNGIIPQALKSGTLEGKVLIDGLDTRTCPIPKLSETIGLVFQNPDNQIFCLRVEDEVAFGLENRAIPRPDIIRRVDEALHNVNLSSSLHKFTFALSGGQKQRLAIADNLAMYPKIMVFDEPTSDLDPLGASEILSNIKKLQKEGVTLIVVEHKMEELAPLADRVLVMDEGEIIFDRSPSELSKDPRVQQIGVALPQCTLFLPKQIFWESRSLYYNDVKDFLYEYLTKRGVRRINVSTPQKPYRLGEIAIEMKNVWYEYGDGTVAVRGVNLKIQEGDFVAIIGQNGSGKSTLAKLAMGLINPAKGEVLVDNLDTRKVDFRQLSLRIGFVFQNPDNQLFTQRVWDEIAFGLKITHFQGDIDGRVSEVLDIIGMKAFKDRHPQSLSRGERRRLAVGTAMALHQKIIILDEPTTGQDYGHSRKLMDFISQMNQKGLTFIMITHDMGLVAEYARRTVVMKDGKVFLDGPTREVFVQKDKLNETMIKPPTVSQLSVFLNEKGIDCPLCLTPAEMQSALTDACRSIDN